MSEECGHVLVIGAASLDIKGRLEQPLVRGSSVPGTIRSSLGGVARNIAENLSKLDVPTVLLTAVGNDDAGERILGRAAGCGIDISQAKMVEGKRTGAYMAIMNEDGTLDFALDNMSIMDELTPEYFESNRQLFEDACLVAIDTNLTPEALKKVVEICDAVDVALCADPTSSTLAKNLCPYISSLYMASPNVPEAIILTGHEFDESDRDAAQSAAAKLVALGVELAVITLGEHGVVYAGPETQGHIPAVKTAIVDQTGAGDAMTAGIIFGLLEDIPLDECVRLGVTAATLTIRTRETVRSDLSVELLYDELII
jgi:pseudouridine kinase